MKEKPIDMVVNGSDSQSQIYYDAFSRKQGAFEHMDFYYFTAILLTIAISLAAMLWKLGCDLTHFDLTFCSL